MKRNVTATLFGLLVAASAAQAQTLQPINPIPPLPPVMKLGPKYDLNVSQVVSVIDSAAETRRATLRLVGGATVVVEFWYPANPPQISFRPYLPAVPASLITNALKAVQATPSYFTTPFVLKVYKESYASIYSGYYGTELHLTAPMPTSTTSFGGNWGGLQALNIIAGGTTYTDAAGSDRPPYSATYDTWGNVVLKKGAGGTYTFHFLRTAAQNWTPMGFNEVETLCQTLLVNLWAHFYGLVADPNTNHSIFIVSTTTASHT